MRKGLGVSPGVSVGRAYCIHEIYVNPQTQRLEKNQVRQELARFDRARQKASRDLHALQIKVARELGEEEAAIFSVHNTILHDPAFLEKVRRWISEDHLTAQAALHNLLNEYSSLFARTKDQYIKERLGDLRDVIIRLSEHLTDVFNSPGTDSAKKDDPLIVIAEELLPSHVMMLGKRKIIGVVTQSGGKTSHAAILARSKGLPAVSGVRGILKQVKNGDTIVVDGREGQVIINPDPETLSAYLKLQREFFDLKDQLAENRDQPAVSADGQSLELFANINNVADIEAAEAMGAAGIGLYRTEYLYLSHPNIPGEQEQYETYRKVIAASPSQRVTIRTLDLGGDKTVPYFGHNRESNPFMGWRSIRLSFEHPEFFQTQIRAILRAAADYGESHGVRIMFPMITTLEEMRRVRAMVRRSARDLEKRGIQVPPVPVGLMLEVPAAAVSIESLLRVVDFVSIGSNDLVQYLMAADRDNPKVSHLCQPLSPPVLKVLSDVIRACLQHDKPVTLCGEMAGSPRAFVLLFAMGLRSFSMSPAFIPSIKQLTSLITQQRAEEILHKALSLHTARQIQRLMDTEMADIAPGLKLLDTT